MQKIMGCCGRLAPDGVHRPFGAVDRVFKKYGKRLSVMMIIDAIIVDKQVEIYMF
jgi:hypothetical protein